MERSEKPSSQVGQEQLQEEDEEIERLLLSLPKTKGPKVFGLALYQGFWCPTVSVRNIISFQRHFQAHDQDIILASKPKSGTTWLKSLLFSIVNRFHYTPSNTPLLNSNSHQLVPFLEFSVYANKEVPDLTSLPLPRLFSTHIPYPSLPGSVKESKCRIIYVCRNPLDVVVSYWYFGNQSTKSSHLSLEECVDSFCNGKEGFGPFWKHVLGYREQSLERPHKVLFLTYEELKADTKSQLKRIADFIGVPFSVEEEKQGVIEEIIRLCSFGNLKELEVNKSGYIRPDIGFNSFFRKGEVGDWANHLSSSMVERLERAMQENFEGSGFNFKMAS